MKELITMEKYVIDYKTTDDYTYRKAMLDYAKLLQSKPTKEHFIGENAIFDGWSVSNSDWFCTFIKDSNNVITFYKDGKVKFNSNLINTLSDLTKFKLKLK